MNKEEILKVIDKGLESLLKEPNKIQQAFSNGCRYTMNVFQSANKYWEKVGQENQQLKEKIKTYEDPEDLTLMYMYCDEKSKDKIKELKDRIDKAVEYIENDLQSFLYSIEYKTLLKILKGDRE